MPSIADIPNGQLEAVDDLLDELSPRVKDKGRELIDTSNTMKLDDQSAYIWWVEGRADTYRVQWSGGLVYSWVSCSCPNGMHSSMPHCYHVAAVLLAMQDEKKRRENNGTDTNSATDS